MYLKYKMRRKSNIKVPVAVWMLNHTRRGGGGRQTRRFRNVELLSMGSFRAPEQSVAFISDMVPTLTGQREDETRS